MKTEKQVQSDAREAARLAAEAEETARRHMFADLEPKFTKFSCWCTALAGGWVDSHGNPLHGDRAAAERRVLAASSAIDCAEKVQP